MTAASSLDRRALLRGAGALGLGAAGATGIAVAGRPAGAAPAAERKGSVPAPRVYGTAEWGARPPAGEIEVLDRVPRYIVVHHTAEPGNSEDYSLTHAMRVCRSIQRFHMDTNGWIDSGQQFTNSRGGHVLEGRHRSLEVVHDGGRHVVGANVGGRNSEVVGIENEGLYVTVDVPPALWDSLVALIAWIATRYGRPVESIMGHRDFNSTECPGEVLYGRLDELRRAVAKAMGQRGPFELPLKWPLLRPNDAGPRVRAAQHLLRARGFSDVPTDGVFGPATRRAVARLADAHGVLPHSCTATLRAGADERGYLGSDIWPLLTATTARPGENADVGAAVGTLHRAGGRLESPGGLLVRRDWQRLLGG
ncbi:N-acetylmuramoyl-L-alanine amidase [Streptomyces sp. OF3]|uniref:N-acetylmuramoyl-L-alanine amidase n=1 Tax=Streptomyces alkaliterrae TaxID=2213162 RepID=A0A7W3WHC4_9ACTN|nr:N-acetylmuramoyl-L-alanine amidase [Streptomyces alkaliterrae]MBB1252378.1 N-acetylmuramoyl-L-alanine amidase [Streptomyces alkaliterrae]